jgi:hypothetical protein
MRRLALIVLACVLTGCGSGAKDELITLDKLPEGLLATAQEKLPDVKFENALKRADGTFEVRGKDKKGKVRDVEMSATGEVLEVE